MTATSNAAADRPDPLSPILERMLRWVLPAATVPLLLFIIAFAIWLWAYQTESADFLSTMNVGLIAAGVLVFLGVALGATALLYNLWLGLKVVDARQDDPDSPSGSGRLVKHAGFHATLLIVNLPVVFLLGTVVVGLTDRTYITIDNQNTKTLSSLSITDSSGEHTLGGVPGVTQRTLRLQPASDFTLSGTLGEEDVDLGQFPLGPGGIARGRVTVSEDGQISVETAAEN